MGRICRDRDPQGKDAARGAALPVADLLWPALIRVDDCILLADRYDERAYRELRARLDQRADVEATINHVHLWDVFIPEDADAAARDAFPDEDMVAEYSDDPISDHGPTVTLHTAGERGV